MVAAILEEEGRFLIARRKNGLWEFPGGKQEPGESPEQALAREMLEELDLAVEVGERFLTLGHDYPDKRIELSLFRCRRQGGAPRCLDCLGWRWASPAEMRGLDFMEADQDVIAALEKTRA